jgi:hypothetical protein
MIDLTGSEKTTFDPLWSAPPPMTATRHCREFAPSLPPTVTAALLLVAKALRSDKATRHDVTEPNADAIIGGE